MGYYTVYDLSLENVGEPAVRDAIVEKLREMEVVGYAFDEDLYSAGDVKWYDHEADMRRVSEAFPQVHFILNGEGEESGDIWRKDFLGGKCAEYYARVVIDDFDPKDLR